MVQQHRIIRMLQRKDHEITVTGISTQDYIRGAEVWD
jgi:hypothetical protein